MVQVSAGARLHFGFGNLSLSHERLYGALGAALAEPRTTVAAERTDDVSVEIDADGSFAPLGSEAEAGLRADAHEYAMRSCDLVGVEGIHLRVEESLPRHAGLGSGTQLALSILTAVARAHDRAPATRERAPALGRGGRSGVGVGSFERGGFVLDAGHPTTQFTTDRPADGTWTVPPVTARHSVPDDWRFLLVVPDADPGRNGTDEDASMRTAVKEADPSLADRIAGVVTRRVLPAIAEGRVAAFGEAVADVGRLNGAWYADQQGGVYRPPVGDLVTALEESAAIDGAGQSSWGPAVYGVTDATRIEAARSAGRAALDAANVDGEVRVVRGRNRGARIERD